MALLASIRPDGWNLALFVHVLGAMLLVGAVLTGASALAVARGNERLLRLGYRSLLLVGLPSYALMWGGGHWIYAREGLDERSIEFAWETIGFVVTEVGAVLFLVALVLGGVGLSRSRPSLLRATMILSLILLAGLVLATWAMTAKPD